MHIDLIGPYSPSNGYSYCLTCIDRFTSWMEVVLPLSNITAENIARAFYEHWITRFGVPSCVITDRGTFISELFRNLASLCGVKVSHTISYHPQSNGKIECLHHTLKTAIRCHNSLHWTETLPTVLMGLRAALHEDCKYTIAEMVYGKTIKLPGEFFEESHMPMSNDNFVSNLRNQMALLKPYQSKSKCKQKICTHARMCFCGLTE
ncbi:uncharacterized protein LOC118197332 [Stegodyphus dumicola]|uniref:uncharacterized protein LOC118197332 n=1 Tax=Stegodyphus dumicola TaxID=202533 RepID=UPI0015A77F00|nr:uncharacterized protein LOC118197332 [Stegodyphus dumicola]